MTLSAAASSAPMSFPRYSELPAELRLQIIEDTLDSSRSNARWVRRKVQFQLSTYACVDREWNRVVELRLFKHIMIGPRSWSGVHDELIGFGGICGKRPGRLSLIRLRLYDENYDPRGNEPHLQILLQLFNLMKDWNHQDREQQGLIEVQLDLDLIPVYRPTRPVHHFDLGRFPLVPVIGSIHEPEPGFFSALRLHPYNLASLCDRLPNVHHASLTLPPRPCECISRQNVIDSLDSLRIRRPGLKHLDLKGPWTGAEVPNERDPAFLPIAECLIASPSPWYERLVSLSIHHNIIVQDFLRDARKVTWPNLKSIQLLGPIFARSPGQYLDEHSQKAVANETWSSVIGEELMAALPSMPKATKFQIITHSKAPPRGNMFKVSIHLGNIARAEKASQPLACGDKFVPTSNNGVARFEGLCPSGSLAVQLQDAVRDHRRQDLEIFYCEEDNSLYFYDTPHTPCVQWNRRTNSWETVFANDLDMFIYEMGQYWAWTHGYYK